MTAALASLLVTVITVIRHELYAVIGQWRLFPVTSSSLLLRVGYENQQQTSQDFVFYTVIVVLVLCFWDFACVFMNWVMQNMRVLAARKVHCKLQCGCLI